ncbi:GGDEF domain-containing protein [Desulfovibrio sp. OttesenSCG-928-C06]|nr:GGDEF domain-containing protein [Desulfovibrio sp. OttesenSCG-928-C06]
MRRSQNARTIWSFGFDGETESRIGKLLDNKFNMLVYPSGEVPGLPDFESQQPCLIMFTPEAHRAMKKVQRSKSKHLDYIPHAMVLDDNSSQEDMEYAIDSDSLAILRPGLSRSAFMKKINAALEIEAVQLDALRMTREIYLEREILDRKNEVLQFLVSFLTQTSVGLDPEAIIRTTFSCLRLLFPVRSIQAALWKPGVDNCDVELFITAQEGSQSFESWRNLMQEQISAALPGADYLLHLRPTDLPDQEEEWQGVAPVDGHVLILPISVSGQQIGIIFILTDMDRSLSRDQALALNSALHFLALTLNNAHNFQDVKQQADFDSLTGIYSRRHFEKRITEEVERANRMHHPLALIFCDIDHFKQINDSKGHQAGDDVLRGVAATIRDIIREQDYPARYGGEEFVILLPRTTPGRAVTLAERLRLAIGSACYDTIAGSVCLTISMGISGIMSGEEKTSRRLLQEADIALYRAKSDSRNCVREFSGLAGELATKPGSETRKPGAKTNATEEDELQGKRKVAI